MVATESELDLAHVGATASGLAHPGSDAPLGVYLQRLWDLRHFAWSHARGSVRASTSTSLLGELWLLLEPALLIAIYFIIFGVVIRADRGVDNFVAFLAIGQIIFTHSRRGILETGGSLLQRGPMLRTFAFPKAILPLSATMRTIVTHAVGLVAMMVFVLAAGVSPRVGWLLVPFLSVAQALMNLGIGLFLARFLVTTDDLGRLLSYVFRLALYGSGVLFSVDAYLEEFARGDLFLKLMLFNPLFIYIELNRWIIMGREPSNSGLMLVAAAIWTFGSLALGFWWFRRSERKYTGFGKVISL